MKLSVLAITQIGLLIAKLLGKIELSWPLVFIPAYIEVAILLIAVAAAVMTRGKE